MKLEAREVQPQATGGSNMSSTPSPIVSRDSQSIGGSKSSVGSPRKIIVPLEGSEFSFRAGEYAINLARLAGGEIICIHVVVDMPYIEYMSPSVLSVPRYIEEAKN
ncbi:MAG: universal stress protein [Nitrososphaera sp.]